jgi:cytochrome c oxidase subunit 3/cytochrome o ubiquinol oxidase subunit 3
MATLEQTRQPSAQVLPNPTKTGMAVFLVSEAAFFGTLITTYLFFLRQTVTSEPSPAEVFYLPLVLGSTACLLTSSWTVHGAAKALHHGDRARFLTLWAATIGLGLCFLVGTGLEWADLIGQWGLTISRNLFGSTYFTLVGFHALHVTAGLITMTVVLGLALRRHVAAQNATGVEAISWYWHFVDGVWVVVFLVVYVVGR